MILQRKARAGSKSPKTLGDVQEKAIRENWPSNKAFTRKLASS
jgi:hypothetical protein